MEFKPKEKVNIETSIETEIETEKENDSEFRPVCFKLEKKAVEIIDSSLPGINRSDLFRNFAHDVVKQLITKGPFSHWEIRFLSKEDVHEVMKRVLIPEI